MAHGVGGRLAPSGLDEQGADAVTINSEILVAALPDQHFVARRKDPAQTRRILIESAAQTLIGDVDERQQPALDNGPVDVGPLPGIEIGAGRIVAAAVEQDDIARAATLDRGHHRVEADAAAGAIVIGIFDRFELDAVNDRLVVGPGRCAENDPRLRVGRGDQLEAEPQRAASARSLQPGDAVVGGMLAEHDRPQQLGEQSVAGAAEIALAVLRLPQPLLGCLDRAQDRGAANAVTIDAYADIDFLRALVGIGEADQLQQRIALDRRKVGNPLAR